MSTRKKPAPANPPLLFISYSHLDAKCRLQMRIHLKPLERGQILRVFDDTELNRDTGWRKQLVKKLHEAELVVMLVSANFLASPFCFEEEWPIAKKRWQSKKAMVTFALVGPCQWKHEDIGELQGVPSHGKLLPDNKRNAAHFWDGIMEKLRADAQSRGSKIAPKKAKPRAAKSAKKTGRNP